MSKKSFLILFIFLFGSFFITADILPPPNKKKPSRIVEGKRNVRIVRRNRVKKLRSPGSSRKVFHNSGRSTKGSRFYKKGHFNYTGFLNPKSKSKVYIYKTKEGITVISDSVPTDTKRVIEFSGEKDKGDK